MANPSPDPKAALEKAFLEYERPIRVANYKLGAMLAMVFLPAGATLDFFVYGWDVMIRFMPVRLGGGVLLGLIWLALHWQPETRLYRWLGFSVALVPQFAIIWMIYDQDGSQSTYYAGLNLVMLGAAILLRWTLQDSLWIFALTLIAYSFATLAKEPIHNTGVYFNNVYFLIVTGIFIAAGTWYYNRIRRNEFELRHRLDANRAELECANSRLADSLAELEISKTQIEESNAKLADNYQKLRELDEVKSRFFANVSHELRTPLTLLIAPIEALMRRGSEMSEDDKSDLLATMHGNSMRLLKLINDLLDLVRLESGTIRIKRAPLPLDEFIHGLGNAVRSVADERRVHLRVECAARLGSVMADAEKIERICLNLLFNALKFTPTGGTVQFTAARDESWLRLEVRDTGMGIAADHIEHIFHRFWQAETSSQRKYQGMGIGLALVKELAEAHGGSVHAESEQGKGTTMIVLLPYQTAGEAGAGTDVNGAETGADNNEWISDLYRRAERFPALTSLNATMRPVEVNAGRKGAKPKILIADDEPDMLRFLRTQLSSHFEVLEAVDGHQAVEKATQFLPDIILSDMMMPEKDGLQVCRELRAKTSTRSIPVVLLTARADEKTKLDCLSAGASDFLAKPFSLTELSVRLSNLVESHRYQRELAVQKQRLEAALEQVQETESLLVRNEKLAALGRMSAGLIHEINNPLNYARQGLYLLRQTGSMLPDKERAEFTDTLKDVEEGVNRVVTIISDLRGFTRTTTEQTQIFDLKQVVDTSVRFFSHDWKDGTSMEHDIPPRLLIQGDSNHFVQVLINLVQNALDAMHSKTYPPGESPLIRLHAHQDEQTVYFSVRDNGSGIPPEIRDTIFDPFFTTKDVGKGMGLGLAIAHRIVTEHQGRISVTSEVGQWTEFVLEFPTGEPILAGQQPSSSLPN